MKQAGIPFRMTRGRGRPEQEEGFKITHVLEAFTSLPRVLHLVWSTHSGFTLTMGILSLLRGFIPAVTVSITRYLIDSVVIAIRSPAHNITMVWVFVGLQLAVGLLDRLFTVLSNIVQQLLQEHVSNRVQLLILEKSNNLDLEFFENAEFYDKMRHAS